MLTLNYHVEIDAAPEKVWQVLTDLELYKQWAKAFSPHSQFDGIWQEGEDIKFFDPDMGGTRAVIDAIEPQQRIELHHVAIFNPEHVQDIDSDVAMKWIGSTESYQLRPKDGKLLLMVTITTHSDFVSMFNHGWEKALPLIKALSEE
ncbi:SRPBCC domain-containing protein [Vibrio vulnificus]|nr:SRPBCC domain-containing protein [Vibrio vulnificus]EHK9050277.1 SRPBCC domain-containing protein [Vibrio vulnificus]EJE8737500.1 SRPBCC domain-containing protein [Vibrio vulnificus]EKA6052146.1 SRPBCC domain-containing protein [Vibrio vulnificus]ELB7645838.1 SRPBCC domain-containing protein [Vibrio vulnificus]